MRYTEKRARKSSKRVKVRIFNSHFSKFRALGTLQHLKQYVFLDVLLDNEAFCFSKRALPMGTARNQWLK